MQLKLRFLAFGLVVLFGSWLAPSQHISAYQEADWPSASSAIAPNVPGTTGALHASVIPAPGNLVTSTLYLPVVARPVEGIFGYLNWGGTPAQYTPLELRFYNGSSYSTIATTTTDSAGYYLFNGMPALGTGQLYYVLYLNPGSDSTRLSTWGSANVTSYTPGSTVALGTSDLANIALAAPSPGATIALPYLFQWVLRTATPSDSYYMRLFNLSTNAYAYTPLFGYVSSVNITGLPSGFYPNVQYGWYMRVVDSNGGSGSSFYYRKVTFSNAGASISGPLNFAPQTTGRRDDIPLPPQREQ